MSGSPAINLGQSIVDAGGGATAGSVEVPEGHDVYRQDDTISRFLKRNQIAGSNAAMLLLFNKVSATDLKPGVLLRIPTKTELLDTRQTFISRRIRMAPATSKSRDGAVLEKPSGDPVASSAGSSKRSFSLQKNLEYFGLDAAQGKQLVEQLERVHLTPNKALNSYRLFIDKELSPAPAANTPDGKTLIKNIRTLIGKQLLKASREIDDIAQEHGTLENMQWVANGRLNDQLEDIHKFLLPAAKFYMDMSSNTSFKQTLQASEYYQKSRSLRTTVKLVLVNIKESLIDEASDEVPTGLLGNPSFWDPDKLKKIHRSTFISELKASGEKSLNDIAETYKLESVQFLSDEDQKVQSEAMLYYLAAVALQATPIVGTIPGLIADAEDVLSSHDATLQNLKRLDLVPQHFIIEKTTIDRVFAGAGIGLAAVGLGGLSKIPRVRRALKGAGAISHQAVRNAMNKIVSYAQRDKIIARKTLDLQIQAPRSLTGIGEDLNRGSGGLNHVYAAKMDGQQVVVKVQERMDLDPTVHAMDEAKALRSLERYGGPKFKGFVTVPDGKGGTQLGVAIERVDGVDLLTAVRKHRSGNPTPLDQRHVDSVNRFFDRLEADGMVATDVQPGDFMFTASGDLVPLDMMVKKAPSGSSVTGDRKRILDYLDEARTDLRQRPPSEDIAKLNKQWERHGREGVREGGVSDTFSGATQLHQREASSNIAADSWEARESGIDVIVYQRSRPIQDYAQRTQDLDRTLKNAGFPIPESRLVPGRKDLIIRNKEGLDPLDLAEDVVDHAIAAAEAMVKRARKEFPDLPISNDPMSFRFDARGNVVSWPDPFGGITDRGLVARPN